MLGKAFSAGKAALFIHLVKMIISWKVDVFCQFSVELPKIDGLLKMSFSTFLDNVFFEKR